MPELTDDDLTFRVQAMTLSAHVTETAIQLAQAAGEQVDRPLTQAQLKRAFDVHVAEDLILTRLLIDHAEFMALPESTRLEMARTLRLNEWLERDLRNPVTSLADS
jgi:hypothetical protein